MQRNVPVWPQIIYGLMMLIPICILLWIIFRYAINLPYWDDYLVQEHLLNLKTGSLRQKAGHLFDQHWEHRIVWTRIIFAAYTKITGSLNYYNLPFIGFAGLLTLLGILVAVFRLLRLPPGYFLPVPFMLFTLQSHENLIWGMASIQNFWILAFAAGAFYLIAQNSLTGRLLALGMGVMATFTSGNGALVLIAGLLVLAYQKQWRFMGVWALVTLGCLAGYFTNYQRITFFPSPFNYPFIDWIKAFFVFLGAFADPYPYSGSAALGYENPLWLTMLLGAIVVGSAFFFVLRYRYTWLANEQTPLLTFCLGCLLFLLATTTITVYSRVGFAGPAYMLQGRYKIYSPFALSVVYLLWIHTVRTHMLRPIGLISALVIVQSLLSDYLCLEGIINQHRRTVAEYFNYIVNTPAERQLAIQQVFRSTEQPFFMPEVPVLSNKHLLEAPVTSQLDTFAEQRFMYNMTKDNAVNPTVDLPTDGSYLLFKSPHHTYLFPARPVRPAPAAISGFDSYFTKDHFYGQVLKEKLAPGQYRIGILTNQNHQLRLAMTNRSVIFTSL
ncbi:hypothetical protein [Arsenicibacter rosenii]|uniref:Glycosyltransferase RgtA/B/C/D-like domain-containing protein n=1 Tax=Arsenicibacter rosenii TaxID=1750698 RepID=A0A1S2VHX4_9BACT|nr:hypothetical protein [Arsenicibacter rosenii]OIN58351.1 hypothetical protein BLX24_15270 [Arsenicibacter rosenii]